VRRDGERAHQKVHGAIIHPSDLSAVAEGVVFCCGDYILRSIKNHPSKQKK
jgi:hypothetical protein